MEVKKLLAEATELKNTGNECFVSFTETNASKKGVEKIIFWRESMKAYHDAILLFLKRIPKFSDTYEETKHSGFEWRFDLNTLEEALQGEIKRLLSVLFCNKAVLFLQEDLKEETLRKKGKDDASDLSPEINFPLKAYYYTKMSLHCNPENPKAKWQYINALTQLYFFKEAQQEVTLLLNTLKGEKDHASMIPLLEELQGEIAEKLELFTSPQKIAQLIKSEPEKLQYWKYEQTFYGPIRLQSVHEDNQKGRGFRAERDIKKGELLLIEKGFVQEEEKFLLDYFLPLMDTREDLKSYFVDPLFPNPTLTMADCFVEEMRDSFSQAMRDQFLSLTHKMEKSRKSQKKEDKVNHNNNNNNNNKEVDNKGATDSIFPFAQLSDEEIELILFKTYLNAFEITHLGVGLFPVLSLFNHSCLPNTFKLFTKSRFLLMFAKRDIAKGEELCVNYCALHDPTPRRQLHLLLTHGFYCNCERCQSSNTILRDQTFPVNTVEDRLTGVVCPECRGAVRCEIIEKDIGQLLQSYETVLQSSEEEHHYADGKSIPLEWFQMKCSQHPSYQQGGTCSYEMPYRDYVDLYENIMDWCSELSSCGDPVALAFRETALTNLKKMNTLLPQANTGHRLRLTMNCGLLKYYSILEDDVKANMYFQRVCESVKAFQDNTTLSLLANSLLAMVVHFPRPPGKQAWKKELEMLFEGFGLSSELICLLWDDHNPVALQRYFYYA